MIATVDWRSGCGWGPTLDLPLSNAEGEAAIEARSGRDTVCERLDFGPDCSGSTSMSDVKESSTLRFFAADSSESSAAGSKCRKGLSPPPPCLPSILLGDMPGPRYLTRYGLALLAESGVEVPTEKIDPGVLPGEAKVDREGVLNPPRAPGIGLVTRGGMPALQPPYCTSFPACLGEPASTCKCSVRESMTRRSSAVIVDPFLASRKAARAAEPGEPDAGGRKDGVGVKMPLRVDLSGVVMMADRGRFWAVDCAISLVPLICPFGVELDAGVLFVVGTGWPWLVSLPLIHSIEHAHLQNSPGDIASTAGNLSTCSPLRSSLLERLARLSSSSSQVVQIHGPGAVFLVCFVGVLRHRWRLAVPTVFRSGF